MKYVSACLLGILSIVLSFMTLDENNKFFNVLSSEGESTSKRIPLRYRCVISLVLGIIGFSATLMLHKNCSLEINVIRLQIAYLGMLGAACVDFRERRIPNVFPAAMALIGLLCLAIMYFTDSDGAFSYILSSLLACVACVICTLLIYALTKGGIGMGDIKLLSALSLLAGANALGCTAAIGALSCGVVTIVLLLAKKKDIKKDSLPFAPFAFLGYAVSIILPIA